MKTFLMRFPMVLFFAVMIAATGCDRPAESANGGQQPTTNTVVREVAPQTASLTGEIGVPQGMDAFGITVFAEGTSIAGFTDSEGRYELAGFREGEYRIRAMRKDLESILVGEVTVTAEDLNAEQPFHRMLRVIMDEDTARAQMAGARQQYGSITGTVSTVVPGDEGGVVVTLEGTRHRTVTIDNGEWQLLNLEPGDYTLVFSKRGYDDLRKPVRVAGGQERSIGSVDLNVLGGGGESQRTIFGRVTMLPADGSVVTDYSGVSVTLQGTSYITTPANDGSFQFRNIPPGVYTISASTPGYLLEQKYNLNLEAVPAVEVELTLVEDTVGLDSQGSLSGTIALEDPPPAGNSGVAVSLAGTDQVAFTDREGNFEIFNLFPGRYDLVATFEGYETAYVEGVNITGGEETILDPVEMKKIVDRPTVVYTEPQDGAVDVAIDQPTVVTIQFSQKMDLPSVIDAISISPEVGHRKIAGRGAQDAITLELQAVPGGSGPVLKYDTRYTVTVAGSAKNSTGVAMKDDYEFSFTTGEARILYTEPADGDEDSAVFYPDVPIAVYFNAPIDTESITADDVRVDPPMGGNPRIHFRRDPQTGWSIMYINGHGEPDTRYRVRIDRGITTVTRDRIQNTPYSFSFRTRDLSTFEEEYGTGDPDYDPAERERERRR